MLFPRLCLLTKAHYLENNHFLLSLNITNATPAPRLSFVPGTSGSGSFLQASDVSPPVNPFDRSQRCKFHRNTNQRKLNQVTISASCPLPTINPPPPTTNETKAARITMAVKKGYSPYTFIIHPYTGNHYLQQLSKTSIVPYRVKGFIHPRE